MRQAWITGEVFKNIFPIPHAVFQLGLTANELLVYLYLHYCRGLHSGKCWPSYSTIGKAVGMDKKTVRKHVCTLVDQGLIETENTTVYWGGHRYNGNLLYTLKPMKQVLKERDDALLAELRLAELRRKASQKVAAQNIPRLKQ